MSNLSIIRTYPTTFHTEIEEINKYDYPKRTSKKDIELIKNISNTPGYIDDFDKWKLGKNYLSKSKNKIKIGGNKHKKLGEKFYLEHYYNYTSKEFDNNYILYNYNIKNILFNEIDNIDWEDYFLKTTKIYKDINIKNIKIDKQNEIINKKNQERDNYNDIVYEIIEKINKLIKWDDYVLFKGKKYGIPYVFKNIHRENDFNGLLKETSSERYDCRCSSCENWNGCGKEEITYYYKCNKCDYDYSKTISGYNRIIFN